MMYLPKLFAHASLILGMFVKMTFASLLLLILLIIPNSLSLCTCPSPLYGEGIVTGAIDICFLYIDSSHVTTSRELIYILERKRSSHICLMWNIAWQMKFKIC